MSGAQRRAGEATKTRTVLPAGTVIGGTGVLAFDLGVDMYERPRYSQPFHAYAILPDGYEAAGYGISPEQALSDLTHLIHYYLSRVEQRYTDEKIRRDALMTLLVPVSA